jgi:hypothetical protein
MREKQQRIVLYTNQIMLDIICVVCGRHVGREDNKKSVPWQLQLKSARAKSQNF